MKTQLNKQDDRFDKFTITIDNLNDLELLGKLLRLSEDHNGYKHLNGGDKESFNKLIIECERITEVKSVEF